MRILDSHFHVWNPDTLNYTWLANYPKLQRPFAVEEISSLARPLGVEGAIVVQAHNSLDGTRELLEFAESNSFIEGVVGWIDLTSPDAAAQIGEFRDGRSDSKLVGIRHEVQAEPDPNWLIRPDVSEGLKVLENLDLSFDLLVLPHQLAAAIGAARRLPNSRMVVDHGAKPPISSGDTSSWRSNMAKIAELEHVYCKLSGLVTEAGPDWSIEMIQPFIWDLLEWFGPDRLMFGSDWPVATQVASYEEVLGMVLECIKTLTPREQSAILDTNARKFYRIENAAP
jgi:L-fuconolactonase